MPMHITYKYARLLLSCLILFSPSAGSANSRDTLAPTSGLDGGTAGRQTTLEMLKATKLKQLLADGHDAFMAQRLVENQVLVAQRSALRLSRAIESYFHLAEFPVSLAYLEKSANFFGISRYELAQMTGIALNPETLYWGARASWTLQTGRMRSDPRIRGLELGEKPTRETLENFIQAQLTFYLAQDLDLAPRAQRWIQDPSKTRQHALDELAFVFEDFLYSERHAQALYDYFKALQDHWDIPTAEIRTAWQSKLTPRQRKIHEHIAQHIAQKDRMTYAEYMDLVLYHPDHGYYMQARDEAFIGGEFDTIPQLTPRLGEAVANDLLIRWNSLGKPKEFDVVEMGAGEGHLARTLLMYVNYKSTSTQARPADPQWQAFAQALRYTILELSPALIAKQKTALGTLADSVTWKHGSAVNLGEVFPPDSITGVFLSNELPDAFPVHKVRPVGGKLQEVYVVHQDGILIEESAPPSTPELQAHLDRRNIQLAEGEEWVINLEADRWMQAMAKALKRGSILTLDYGHHSGQNRAIRNNMGQVRSFGRFAYQRLLHYAGIDVARDQARERFQQEMAKSSGKDPFFEARQMLLESINHVLSFAGEVDLTTNVDFEALLYEASRLGFHEESFDSQREYMKLMLVRDPERHARINEAVQQISQMYFVQTLSLLKQRERIAEGLPTGAYDLLLRKKTIDHAGDIHVLFDFLEEYDPAGLGSVARAYRQESQRQRRPLVGISLDSLIFLTEDIFTPLFQKDQGYLQRSTFPQTIPVKTGRTLEDVLKLLIHDLPTHALPPAYQEMGQAIPEITAGMSFLQVFNALKIRGEIERTLEQKAAADLLQALDKIGYPARDYGYTPKELEALTHKKWGNLRKSIVQAEPDRTLVVVEAILKALHVFYERDEQRFAVNPQLFLEDPTGLKSAMRIEWPLFIEYIGQHIEAIAPGVGIDALMAGAQAHVNPRLANKVQEVLAGSARTEPTEVRLAILEGFISVLNEKLDPLSPLSKDAAHAIPQMAIGKRAILAGVESDHARVRVPSDGDREHIIPLQSSGPVDLDRLRGGFAEMGLHAADGQRVSRLLSLLQKAPKLFIFEKVVEDFLGFANAQEQAIGLHQELAADPIAQFHELGEYLAATGEVQLQFKGNSALLLKKFRLLDRYNKTVPLSGEIIVRDSAGNGIDIIPVSGEALSIALKGPRDPHYLFRAIARQLLGARDVAFTQKIKALTAKPRPAASPKLPAQGQPPAVSPGFSVVGIPSPLETVSPPGHPTAISL